MPFEIPTSVLRAVVRPIVEVREQEQTEGRVQINNDHVRLQCASEAQSLTVDHTLPVPVGAPAPATPPATFWGDLSRIDTFLTAGATETVRVTPPFESGSDYLYLESGGVRYALALFNDQFCHRVRKTQMPDAVTAFTIPLQVLSRSITAADLMGDVVTVEVHPDAKQIEFKSNPPDADDSFTYQFAPTQFDSIDEAALQLTVEIDILQEFVTRLPETGTVSFALTPDYLRFHVEHPTSGADLTVDVAEHLTGLY